MNETIKPVEEFMKGRVSTKGNIQQSDHYQTLSWSTVASRMLAVREAAEQALLRQVPEVGAVCVSSARTDLCGGWLVTAIPTAT